MTTEAAGAPPARRATLPVVLLFVVLVVGWGANWPIMKVALREIAPLHFRSTCLFVAAAAMFLAARWSRLPIAVPPGQWTRLAIISLFNYFLWNVCAIYGLTMLAAGRAAIIAYTMPLWSVLLAVWVLNERLSPIRWIGLASGMVGMGLLLGEEITAAGRSPLGALLMLASAISWGIGIVIMKRWPVDLPASSLSAWQMLLGGLPILAGALLFEDSTFFPWELSTQAAWSATYTIVVAFVFCQWAWIKIAMAAPVAVSALSALIIPVVGVFTGALVLGETPRWLDYVALAFVLVALASVTLVRDRPAPAPPAPT
jgi:drug/metabolite transporter (DMT)-like permease